MDRSTPMRKESSWKQQYGLKSSPCSKETSVNSTVCHCQIWCLTYKIKIHCALFFPRGRSRSLLGHGSGRSNLKVLWRGWAGFFQNRSPWKALPPTAPLKGGKTLLDTRKSLSWNLSVTSVSFSKKHVVTVRFGASHTKWKFTALFSFQGGGLDLF